MQYLTFKIGGETCAVEITNVQSVLDREELTVIPGSPDYVVGLLNLRGDAVPVVDVRRKLRLEASSNRDSSGIIVLSLPGSEGTRQVGALVDSVCEVVQLDEPFVSRVEDLAIALDSSVVRGIGKKDGRFILIMAIERLLSRETLGGAA